MWVVFHPLYPGVSQQTPENIFRYSHFLLDRISEMYIIIMKGMDTDGKKIFVF